jgi:hypothetical protein
LKLKPQFKSKYAAVDGAASSRVITGALATTWFRHSNQDKSAHQNLTYILRKTRAGQGNKIRGHIKDQILEIFWGDLFF